MTHTWERISECLPGDEILHGGERVSVQILHLENHGDWTEVTPVRPGPISIEARFDVKRMADQTSFCSSAGDDL